MPVLPVAFAVSAAVTMLIVVASRVHTLSAADADFSQPQKFHAIAVPRIGGIGIFAGMLCSALGAWVSAGPEAARHFLILLACAVPAFVAGVAQDFTEALTPRSRLIATMLSAALAFTCMDAAIRQTSIPGLDWLVSYACGSFLVTLFAVTGIAHAFNLIDGFNGLTSMCTVLMLAALWHVSMQVQDPLIGTLALGGIGAVLGFFCWNFPVGLVFLGDGGAYLLGFFVSETSLLLLLRHPGQVSPLFPLLVCAYPVFETVFSIYRRAVLRSLPPSRADGIHLHSLIYRRILRQRGVHGHARVSTWRNSMTSPYLWLLCGLSIAPALAFFDDTAMLAAFQVLFGVSYVWLYWRIVRFRSPRWLRYPARPARRGAR